MSRARRALRRLASSSFAKSSAIHLGGSVLNAMLPLLVMPILTRLLRPEDYGIMRTGTILSNIFIVLIGLNAYGLIARTYFERDAARLRALLNTSLIFNFIAAGVMWIVCLIVGGWLEKVTQFPEAWLGALVLFSLFSVLQTVYLSFLQVRNESWKYVLMQTLGGVVNLGLSVWLVMQFQMDWRGRMWALMASVAVVALWGLLEMWRSWKLLAPTWSKPACKEMAAFGIPLIPHTLGGWVMTMAAGLFLNNMATIGDTGFFSVAFNLASPIALLIGAANRAYVPALFERLSRPDAPDLHRVCRILLAAAFALPLLGVAWGLFCVWCLPWIVGPRFVGAAGHVFWLSMAYASQGIYYIFGNFVIYAKRTSLMAWRADFLGGIVLLISCPLLILWIGPVGASVATFLGFATSTIGCISAARIAHPMPWAAALKSILSKP